MHCCQSPLCLVIYLSLFFLKMLGCGNWLGCKGGRVEDVHVRGDEEVGGGRGGNGLHLLQ